jgi:hypothetical protein
VEQQPIQTPQKLQTSFISKQALARRVTGNGQPVGIFLVLAIIVFLLSLAAFGGAYAYRFYTRQNITSLSSSLNQAKAAFEPDLIFQLTDLDSKLQGVKEILASHQTLAPLFSLLEEATLKSVRFTNFTYKRGERGQTNDVTISGEAQNFEAIALETQSLGERRAIKNPIFTNLGVNNKGNVTFQLTFSVDPSLVSYVQTH